jgi:hypothetical protein
MKIAPHPTGSPNISIVMTRLSAPTSMNQNTVKAVFVICALHMTIANENAEDKLIKEKSR